MTTPLMARRRRLAQTMRRIRNRVAPPHAAGTGESGSPDPVPPAPAEALPTPWIHLPKVHRHAGIEPKNRYRLHEFLDLHDADFVRCAYVGLLGRAPDEDGFHHHLSNLRGGVRTKIEVLGRIRYSREGRTRRVRVSGLLLPFLVSSLYRVPVLGYLLRLPIAVLRLPRNAGNVARLEAYLNNRLSDLESSVDRALAATERFLQQADQEQARLRLRDDALQGEISGLGQVKADEQAVQALGRRVAALSEQLEEEVASLVSGSARREALDALARRVSQAEAAAVRLDLHTSQLAALGDGLAGLGRRLGEQEKTSASRDALAELSAALDRADQRLSALDARQGASDERAQAIDRLEAELAALAEGAAGRDRVDELSRRLDALATRAVDLEAHERLVRELAELEGSRVAGEQLDAAVARVERLLEARAGQLESLARSLRADAERRTDEQAGRIDALETTARTQRLAILEQQRSHDALLRAARERVEREPAAASVRALADEAPHAHDEIYARFEDHFRGSSEEIRERLRTYLPLAGQAVEATGGAPLLDLGCGRGEWLEIATAEGWRALGVDSNRIMVQRCRDQGLEVEEAEALAFLRAADADAFSVVTAIHVAEHLPFDDVVALVDESRRVLRRGGLLILETPNPENLLVGACNFYADPTHRSPIFPPTLEFVVRERGFDEVEIVRLSRGPSSAVFEPLAPDTPLAARLNPILAALEGVFSAAPDFAVVGRKG